MLIVIIKDPTISC